jgi:hypothetical protein
MCCRVRLAAQQQRWSSCRTQTHTTGEMLLNSAGHDIVLLSCHAARAGSVSGVGCCVLHERLCICYSARRKVCLRCSLQSNSS